MAIIRSCIDSGRYRETYHAICREEERKIILPDICYVLKVGYHEKRKDKFDGEYDAWNYAIRGKTSSGEDLRVIVSFEQKTDLLIITAIRIGGVD